jgi:hypothetical protein
MARDRIEERLEPGETVTWSRRANRFQGSRGVGGRLVLTDRRLLFAPHRFDAALAGSWWEAELDQVSSVGVERRGSAHKALLGGGLRRRLRVQTEAGEDELFLVNKLDQVLESLTEAGLRHDTDQGAARPGPLGPPPGT